MTSGVPARPAKPRSRSAMRLSMLAGMALLAVAAANGVAAPARVALSASVRLLASIGCARVPEASGPDLPELQCADDRAYLLCTAMQAQDHRLDCAIDAAASKVDLAADPAVATARPGFARLADAEPCVAWAYPNPGADKRRHGSRCALGILTSLHCTVGATGETSCPPAAMLACVALQAASDTEACSMDTEACSMARPR